MHTSEDAGRRLKPMAAMKQNLVFDAGAPALAEMATDQRKQADPYASDYKLGAKELSFTTPALYTENRSFHFIFHNPNIAPIYYNWGYIGIMENKMEATGKLWSAWLLAAKRLKLSKPTRVD